MISIEFLKTPKWTIQIRDVLLSHFRPDFHEQLFFYSPGLSCVIWVIPETCPTRSLPVVPVDEVHPFALDFVADVVGHDWLELFADSCKVALRAEVVGTGESWLFDLGVAIVDEAIVGGANLRKPSKTLEKELVEAARLYASVSQHGQWLSYGQGAAIR